MLLLGMLFEIACPKGKKKILLIWHTLMNQIENYLGGSALCGPFTAITVPCRHVENNTKGEDDIHF